MYSSEPDLVILLSARALLSLLGVVLISVGTWWMDRRWDATPTADAKAAKDEYAAMEDNAIRDESEEEDGDTWVVVCQAPDLNRLKLGADALTTLLGWVLLAVSYLQNRQYYFKWDVRWMPITCASISVVVALVQVIWLRQAMISRTVRVQRHVFVILLGGGMLLIGGFTAALDPDAPEWASPLGSICVLLAPAIMWYARRMGHMYEKEGTPNPNPLVFNYGGPLTVFGWFWFWIGMNAIAAQPDSYYIPFYLGHRTGQAFLGAVVIVIVMWLCGFALDEMEEPTNLLLGPAFGINDFFFGSVWEIKLAVVLSWIVFAATVFMPMITSYWQYALFVVIVVIGFAMSAFLERALRSKNPPMVKKVGIVTSILLVVFAVLVSMDGLTACILVLLGVTSFVFGQLMLHEDRKRGAYWMETGKPHPEPLAYSIGSPLTSLGMLLMAWALSMR